MPAAREWQAYVDDDVGDDDTPLLYWKRNEKRWPHLAAAAKQLLAAAPSSVDAGDVVLDAAGDDDRLFSMRFFVKRNRWIF